MTPARLAIVALLGLLTAASARADDEPAPAIRDEAGLFGAEAIHQADETAAAIRDIYRVDFVLETVAAPPEEMRKKVASMKAGQVAQYFQTWAAGRAEAEGVDGVYVLVCVDPGYVQAAVRPESRGRMFTAADAKRLQNRLKYMKKGPNGVKDRDARLVDAVKRVRDDIGYNLRPQFPWVGVGGVMAGVLAVWGALALVRTRMRAADGPPEPRRLDLFHALLGGMFGAPAAHWIYDSLFIAGSRSVAPAAPLVRPNPAAVESTEADEPRPATKAERLDLAARDHAEEATG